MIAVVALLLLACALASSPNRPPETLVFSTLRMLSPNNTAYLSDNAARLHVLLKDCFFRAFEDGTGWLPYAWESANAASREEMYVRWQPAGFESFLVDQNEMINAAHILLGMHTALRWRTRNQAVPQDLIALSTEQSEHISAWTRGARSYREYALLTRASLALLLPSTKMHVAFGLMCDLPLSMCAHILKRAYTDLRGVSFLAMAVARLLDFADPREVLADHPIIPTLVGVYSQAPRAFMPRFGTQAVIGDGITANAVLALPNGEALFKDDDNVVLVDLVDAVLSIVVLEHNDLVIHALDDVSLATVRSMNFQSRVRMAGFFVSTNHHAKPLAFRIAYLSDAIYSAAFVCATSSGERTATLSLLHPLPELSETFSIYTNRLSLFSEAIEYCNLTFSRMRTFRALALCANPMIWSDFDKRALQLLVAAGTVDREMHLGLFAKCSTALRTTNALIVTTESARRRLSRDDDLSFSDDELIDPLADRTITVVSHTSSADSIDAAFAQDDASFDSHEGLAHDASNGVTLPDEGVRTVSTFETLSSLKSITFLNMRRISALLGLSRGNLEIASPEQLVDHAETILLLADGVRLNNGLYMCNSTREVAQFIHDTYISTALIQSRICRAAGLGNSVEADCNMPSVRVLAAMLPAWDIEHMAEGEEAFGRLLVAAHRVSRYVRLFAALREDIDNATTSPDSLETLEEDIKATLRVFFVAEYGWEVQDVAMFAEDISPETCVNVFMTSFESFVDIMGMFVTWRDAMFRGHNVHSIIAEVAQMLVGSSFGGSALGAGGANLPEYPVNVPFSAYREALGIMRIWETRRPLGQDTLMWTVGPTTPMIGWNDALIARHAFASPHDLARAMALAVELNAMGIDEQDVLWDVAVDATARQPWTREFEDILRERLAEFVRNKDEAEAFFFMDDAVEGEHIRIEQSGEGMDASRELPKRRIIPAESPRVRSMLIAAVVIQHAQYYAGQPAAPTSSE